MKLLARINKSLKLVELKYVVFSPNDFCYNNLKEKSIFVQFNGAVYRKDGIDRDAEITRELVYSAIEDDNKTWIGKVPGGVKDIEGELELMKDGKGSRGIALSEILKTR